MTPRVPVHVSAEADPAERGHALGAAHAKAVRSAYEGYADVFAAWGLGENRLRDLGLRALTEITAWAPELAAEITGIAGGARLDAWRLGVLNARTEVLAAAAVGGEGECSTVVTLPCDGTAPRTMQTWDWHDTLRHVMLTWSLEPRPGRRVCTFTEFGVVGKIGVNDAGLGLHFNVLRHHSDHPDVGVPVHVVARRILDEAATVDDAVRLARSARLSASSVLTIVTLDDARCLELSPDGVAELAPEDGFLAHTNHFLDAKLAAGERTTTAVSSTAQRLAWLREHAAALGVPDRTERARALCAHARDGAPVCAHPDFALPAHERWESLATIALDVVACRLDVHRGGPCAVAEETWQSLSAS